MIAKFNPTGTHVHKGFLKVRVDLYPDVGDKTYPIHHIQVPVIPPEDYQGVVDAEGMPVNQSDYDNWIDSLPKIWQLNPALCHFIKVNPDISLLELKAKVKEVFDSKAKIDLDDALSKENTQEVSQIMRTNLGDGKVVSKFTKRDRDNLNTRLTLMEIS